jgi:carboxylesterase type B
VAALKWVKDNVASFGGDPSNVTIGGQSAGSRNVGMLLRTPMAKGLFHRVVMESATGGLLDTKFPSLSEKEAANKAAIDEIFGRPMSLSDLRAVPAEDFIKVKVGDKNLLYALHAKVGQHIVDGTVLTEASVNLLRNGALNGIDILIGANADERTSLDGKPDGTLSDESFSSTMQKTYGDEWKPVYKASDQIISCRTLCCRPSTQSIITMIRTPTSIISTILLLAETLNSTARSTRPISGISLTQSVISPGSDPGPMPITGWRPSCRPTSRTS